MQVGGVDADGARRRGARVRVLPIPRGLHAEDAVDFDGVAVGGPTPYLVTDTGYSAAPYNHFEIGQPFAIDYVWGRQFGEHTINP